MGKGNRRKSLTYGDGYIKNENNVLFTPEERKALENAVNRANYKRKKQVNEWEAAPHKIGGRQIAPDKTQLKLMGDEPDLIITRKSKSLQQFKTKDEYYTYMEYLNRVNQKDYLDSRISLYKENYIKALKKSLNDKRVVAPLEAKIKSMSNKDFYKLALSDKLLSIKEAYLYRNKAKQAKRLYKTFGVKGRDELDIIDYI